MDPVFIPKKGLLKLADTCLLYKKSNGKRKKLNLAVHQHSFLFYIFNHSIPPSTSPLIPTQLSDEQLRLAYHCVLMSYLAYEDRSKIDFPEDIIVVYEEYESDITKIPFFIAVDSEVNAIIIACRGSSCIDDFITDSMGNGINFDGGKIHQGEFNTASYVFLQSQNIILDLNKKYNHEDIIHRTVSQMNTTENLNNTTDAIQTSTNNNNNQEEEEESDSNLFGMKEEERMKIIVTGHSLGAGVAAVVAQLFRREFPQLDVQGICFAPPPTYSFNLWAKSADYIKSYMIEGDLVPFLSVQNIFKFSKVLFPDQNSKFVQKFIAKYLKKMSIDEVTETFMNEKLYPPGQCYLIRLPQTNPNKEKKEKHRHFTKSEKKEMKAKNLIKHKNISICQIFNPDYFSNFVKNIQETNHKCKNYMKCIIRLRQQQIQEKDIQEIIKRKDFKKKEESSYDETEEDGVERIV